MILIVLPDSDRPSVSAAGIRLAVRAPEGHPFPGIFAARGLPGGGDRSAAPPAGAAGPPVHPGFGAPLPPARGDLADPVLVRVKQPAGQADQRIEVAAAADRLPWAYPAQEEHLAFIKVADAGQVSLVEQCLGDGPGRVPPQAADCLRGVPVRAKQVGAQVADQAVFLARRQDLAGSATSRPSAGANARSGRRRCGSAGACRGLGRQSPCGRSGPRRRTWARGNRCGPAPCPPVRHSAGAPSARPRRPRASAQHRTGGPRNQRRHAR